MRKINIYFALPMILFLISIIPAEVNMGVPAGVSDSGYPATNTEIKIDASGTWKPYMVAYKIIKETVGMENGKNFEVIIKDNKGVLADIKLWCESAGYVFLGSENKDENKLSLFVRKGDAKRDNHKMTVVISTANLEKVLLPFDKALSGAVMGMGVNVFFEGAGVRLLKKDYRSKLSGVIGGIFTGKVEGIMEKDIGWPAPKEAISILEDLGADFYVCGPSMVAYGVKEEDIMVKKYAISAVITAAKLLADSDIHIFSRAEFEKP